MIEQTIVHWPQVQTYLSKFVNYEQRFIKKNNLAYPQRKKQHIRKFQKFSKVHFLKLTEHTVMLSFYR